MTLPDISISSLKQIKNSVIGNPLAKIEIVRDELFVSALVDCLNVTTEGDQALQDALRIEAAHVIASLAYGSDEALGTLLQANVHHAFLYAISHFTPADSNALRSAFSRALRALAASIADVVGPSIWGLRPEKSSIRNAAQQALSYLFQNQSLDNYLPLLVPASSQNSSVATSTAQMLATAVRSDAHRRAATEWLPPSERQQEVKSKRGWEKTALSATASSPWVIRQLLVLLGDHQKEKDSKLVEAVLSALASLSRENSVVANYLAKSSDPPPLANILAFTKSRSTDVQLAACLCVTHILRASTLGTSPSGVPLHPHAAVSPSTSHASSSSLHHGHAPPPTASHPPLDDLCTRTVMNVVNRMLASSSAPTTASSLVSETSASHQTKTKACYILHYLVSDDATLCHAAFDRGCLDYLGHLIQSIHPPDSDIGPEWEESEPESLSSLREAALIALASLALCSDDIRRRITENLALLPYISRALRFKQPRHVGTRYAACQCVRAMSRAVSVLRTSIVDSGLGMDVLRIVLGQELGDKYGGNVSGSSAGGSGGAGKEKEKASDDAIGEPMDVEGAENSSRKPLGEDRRVLGAALAAVSNIVNDFSPLRPIYLEEKLMPRLVFILKESDDPGLRLNALWAVKNLVRKTSTETKRYIMSCLGWSDLSGYLSDSDEDIQEQGFNTLRNLAENEDGIAMVFRELGPQVLEKIVAGLRSPSEDVVLQSAFCVANLVNGNHEQQDMILHYPGMLTALQTCLAEMGPDVRRPAVSCVLVLAQSNPRRRKEMMEAGIVGTLKRLCEWSGHASGHGHGHGAPHSPVVGMSLSPPVGGGGGHWGGRSPGVGIRSTASSAAHPTSQGVYGSWSGSGSMMHHHHSHSYVAHHAAAGGHRPHGNHHHWTSHMALEDDKDVVQRARSALEWLEHGETYST